MENILNIVTTNNIALAAVIILGVFIIYSLVKKVIKIALISLLLVVIYIAYLSYTGEKIPETRKEVIDHISAKIKKGARKGKELLDKNLGGIKVKNLN